MEMTNLSIDEGSQSQQTATAAAATSRWNPTKEQIDMLEGLYKQGIRTPSAEQIQHITSKLKVYGHIEGKNVFYWFQNHKARQRQKQKQETNLLYFNRFLHKPTTIVTPPVFIPSPISPPPPPPPLYNNNGICNQFYIPPPSSQANIGYYHQYPITNKVPLPTIGVVKRRSSRTGVMMMKERKLESSSACGGVGFYPVHNNRMVQQPDAMQGLVVGGGDVNENNHINTPLPLPLPSENSSSRERNETLELFPVHPTGVLNDHDQPNEDSRPCSFPFAAERNDDHHQQPFFDFFAGQQQQH